MTNKNITYELEISIFCSQCTSNNLFMTIDDYNNFSSSSCCCCYCICDFCLLGSYLDVIILLNFLYLISSNFITRHSKFYLIVNADTTG